MRRSPRGCARSSPARGSGRRSRRRGARFRRGRGSSSRSPRRGLNSAPVGQDDAEQGLERLGEPSARSRESRQRTADAQVASAIRMQNWKAIMAKWMLSILDAFRERPTTVSISTALALSSGEAPHEIRVAVPRGDRRPSFSFFLRGLQRTFLGR